MSIRSVISCSIHNRYVRCVLIYLIVFVSHLNLDLRRDVKTVHHNIYRKQAPGTSWQPWDCKSTVGEEVTQYNDLFEVNENTFDHGFNANEYEQHSCQIINNSCIDNDYKYAHNYVNKKLIATKDYITGHAKDFVLHQAD